MSLPTSAPQCEFKSKPKLSKCIAILHLGKVYAPVETLFVSQEKAPDPPKEKPFQCEESSQHFSQKKTLQMHTGPHTCDTCGKGFARKYNLKMHKKTQRKCRDDSDCDIPTKPKFQCPKCPYATDRKGRLKDHMTMHMVEKPHRCEVCGKTFGWKSNLTHHLRIHTRERPVCVTCGRELTQRRNLQAREKKQCCHCQSQEDQALDDSSALEGHEESAKLKCSLCPYSTHRKYFLVRHMLTHSAKRELPYRCEHCDKGFAQEKTLLAHRLLHTGELPYVCVTCGKRFTCSLYLRKHQKTHSQSTEETSDALGSHAKPVGKFRCKECPYTTNYKGNLYNHLHTHDPEERPHRCELCGKGFQLKAGLKSHAVVHTRERPFVCDTCGKAFGQKHQLTVHARLHSGEKPFPCEDCGKRFASPYYLKQHQRVHARRGRVAKDAVVKEEEEGDRATESSPSLDCKQEPPDAD